MDFMVLLLAMIVVDGLPAGFVNLAGATHVKWEQPNYQ
jgi:hypothetical protein